MIVKASKTIDDFPYYTSNSVIPEYIQVWTMSLFFVFFKKNLYILQWFGLGPQLVVPRTNSLVCTIHTHNFFKTLIRTLFKGDLKFRLRILCIAQTATPEVWNVTMNNRQLRKIIISQNNRIWNNKAEIKNVNI